MKMYQCHSTFLRHKNVCCLPQYNGIHFGGSPLKICASVLKFYVPYFAMVKLISEVTYLSMPCGRDPTL